MYKVIFVDLDGTLWVKSVVKQVTNTNNENGVAKIIKNNF